MTKKREPLTFEQHQEHGEALQRFRNHLGTFYVALANAYGQRSKVALQAWKTLGELDELRNRLDSKVFAENPGRDSNENASVYYAASRIR